MVTNYDGGVSECYTLYCRLYYLRASGIFSEDGRASSFTSDPFFVQASQRARRSQTESQYLLKMDKMILFKILAPCSHCAAVHQCWELVLTRPDGPDSIFRNSYRVHESVACLAPLFPRSQSRSQLKLLTPAVRTRSTASEGRLN